MKLNAVKFGLAAGLAFALIWMMCVVILFMMPFGVMPMAGTMMHGEMLGMLWEMGIVTMLFGGLAWMLVAGFTGWLIAAIYNLLL